MPYIPGANAHGVIHIADVYHSPNVYANNVLVALWNDPAGTEAAVMSQIAAPEFSINLLITETIEGESTDTAGVEQEQKKLVEIGALSQADLDAGKNAANNATAVDNTPGVATTATTTGTTTVNVSVDDTILYISPNTGITYTVRSVTKQPGVVYPYDVATVAPQNGVSVQEVCDNLRLLIINCFDKIKQQYPDAFMTNSFRARGTGSPTSQHIRGMACDIQYASASKADYYTRAQWIKNNVSYDQFLLEYKTTGTRNPWHHISFNKSGNRSQVCTFMNDKNCKAPGVQGLFDLSNT